MKLAYLLFFLLILSTVSADLNEGLYSYFPFEDKNDVLGYATTGEHGTPEYTPGLIGNALNITTDAANEMIYFGESIADRDDTYRRFLTEGGTINVWMNIREMNSLSRKGMVLLGGSPHITDYLNGCVYSTNHWQIYMHDVPNCNYYCSNIGEKPGLRYEAYYYDDNNELFEIVRLENLSIDYHPNQWYMITVTYNPSNGIWQMHLNTNTLSTASFFSTNRESDASECPYSVGNRPLDTYDSLPFAGLIDELGFWNRVLSQEEIQVLYNEGHGLGYPFPSCGDGIVQEDEVCDDGNLEDGDGCSSACTKEVDPRLQQYAPMLYMHPLEPYYPNSIQSLLNISHLRKGIWMDPSPTDVSELPTNSRNYYLDMLFDTQMPEASLFVNYTPTIYGRVEEDDKGYTHLQYFIFYPYQDWHFMDHEGDWELFQVTLNPADKIESVLYFFDRFAMAHYEGEDVDFVDGHPVVYVSKGSHNNYADDSGVLLDGTQEFFNELLTRFFTLEQISEEGEVYSPEDAEHQYELEQIYDDTRWINYEGLWGEDAPYILHDGPRGPQFNSRWSIRWREPQRYTYAPNIPFMSVFLFSPLDITIADENGMIEPSNLDLYTGPDSDPEMATVYGPQNYTLYLTANDAGNFTLEVFYYHNESNNSLYVKYGEISNTEYTMARLNVSLDSLFVLEVDEDGDGVYEHHYLPDDWLVTDFVLPDRDGDGYHDFTDNCVDIPNDQSDFNYDGRGDACDNPRYYREKAYEIASERVRKQIEKSLDPALWEDDFTINSRKVLAMDASVLKQADEEVLGLLALSDKLLVEWQMPEDAKTLALYGAANILYEYGFYEDAIRLYARAYQ